MRHNPGYVKVQIRQKVHIVGVGEGIDHYIELTEIVVGGIRCIVGVGGDPFVKKMMRESVGGEVKFRSREVGGV